MECQARFFLVAQVDQQTLRIQARPILGMGILL